MSKSNEFVELFVTFVQEETVFDDAVNKLKGELNAINFNPSDQLIALVTPIDDIEEDEDEDETEGYWGDDDEEDEEVE